MELGAPHHRRTEQSPPGTCLPSGHTPHVRHRFLLLHVDQADCGHKQPAGTQSLPSCIVCPVAEDVALSGATSSLPAPCSAAATLPCTPDALFLWHGSPHTHSGPARSLPVQLIAVPAVWLHFLRRPTESCGNRRKALCC